MLNFRRKYENDEILKIVLTGKLDHNSFWKLLRRDSGDLKSKTIRIERSDGVDVNKISDVLHVWK